MEAKEMLIQTIGLGEREAKTYLALLKLGKTTTGPLSEESSVPSSKIYSVLASLENKGLASHIVQGKTKYFQGEEPKKILSLFKEKERALFDTVKELEEKKVEQTKKSSAEFFEGVSAIKNLLIDLSENAGEEEWFGFGNGENLATAEVADFYEWWGNQKIKTNLTNLNIISLKSKNILKERYKEELKLMKGRFFFVEHSLPQDIAIIKDTIVLMQLSEKASAVKIENSELAKHYKTFFLEMLKKAEPL